MQVERALQVNNPESMAEGQTIKPPRRVRGKTCKEVLKKEKLEAGVQIPKMNEFMMQE